MLGSENKPSELQLSRRGPLRMLRQTKVATHSGSADRSLGLDNMLQTVGQQAHSRRHPLEIQVSVSHPSSRTGTNCPSSAIGLAGVERRALNMGQVSHPCEKSPGTMDLPVGGGHGRSQVASQNATVQNNSDAANETELESCWFGGTWHEGGSEGHVFILISRCCKAAWPVI